MANTALDLSQIKAPGVYTFEFDDSEYTQVESNTLRLIVGFSRKGFFNRPVLIRNRKEAIAAFGDIDPFLEKRGSFFHRSLFTALQAGPVYALALLPTNNGQNLSFDRDEVEYKSFSIDTTETNSKAIKALYSSFYDKERFWVADEDNFAALVDQNGGSLGKILSFANLGQKRVTILVRKTNVRGFDLTARDYYGAGNVPEYIKDFDYMNDYFVEVTIVEGNWSDYDSLSADPRYSTYFDLNGLKKSQLTNFLADETVNLLGRFEGSVIPELIDGNGRDWSIDTTLNQNLLVTGVFATIDSDMLSDYENRSTGSSDVDMIGHKLAQAYGESTQATEIDFLSYRKNMVGSKVYGTGQSANTLATTIQTSTLSNVSVTSLYTTTDKGMLNNRIKIQKPLDSETAALIEYNNVKANVKLGTAIVNGYDKSTNVAVATYFSVTDFFESDGTDENGNESTFLYLTVRNKKKRSEETNLSYTFNNTDLSANNVVVNSYSKAGPTIGSEVYFKPKTTANSSVSAYYAKISNVGVDASLSTANLAFSGLSASLTSLGVSNVTHDVIISDYYVLQSANSTTLDYTLQYSTSPSYVANVSGTSLYSYSGDDIYQNYIDGMIKSGDVTSDTQYVKFEKLEDANGLPVVVTSFYTTSSLSSTVSTSPPSNDSTFTISTSDTNIIQAVKIVAGSLSTDQKSAKITSANSSQINVGDYLMTRVLEDSTYVDYFTKVTRKIKNTSDNTYTISTNNNIYVVDNSGEEIYRMKNFEEYVSHYNLHSLQGFTMGEFHLPGTSLTKQSQLEKIVEVMDSSTNLYKALTDNDQIEFRYIVDTFSGGLKAESYPKSIMTKLAKDKGKCLAIMNAPSIKEFKDSTDPRFTDAPSPSTGNPKPVLKVEYIKDGGNLSLGPSTLYSLPSEANGSKYAGFFISYPYVRDGRRTFAVPPAASISNNYVNKFKRGEQYLTVAGTRRGVVSVPGSTGTLEYNFTSDDRGFLADIGINPLVYKRGAGYVIFDDLMAYQNRRSAFNNLSLRDVLISIEDGIEDLIRDYLFDYNDEALRVEISDKVKTFLANIQLNGGIAGFEVQMNEINNTSETIQQGFGILDVTIEPQFPVRKFVNKITVTGAGRLTQNGFN